MASTRNAKVAGQLASALRTALGPTIEPLVRAQEQADATWSRAAAAGVASNLVPDATDLIIAAASALGADVVAGWTRTVESLEPVLKDIQLEEDDREKLLRYRDKFREAFAQSADTLSAQLLDLQRAPDLEGAGRHALVTYHHDTGQKLEVLMDGAKQILVEAAWLSGRS